MLIRKNFWYFLGAISELKLGWISEITFQLTGEALKIIGPRTFISLLLEDEVLPFIVLHSEMRQVSMTSL